MNLHRHRPKTGFRIPPAPHGTDNVQTPITSATQWSQVTKFVDTTWQQILENWLQNHWYSVETFRRCLRQCHSPSTDVLGQPRHNWQHIDFRWQNKTGVNNWYAILNDSFLLNTLYQNLNFLNHITVPDMTTVRNLLRPKQRPMLQHDNHNSDGEGMTAKLSYLTHHFSHQLKFQQKMLLRRSRNPSLASLPCRCVSRKKTARIKMVWLLFNVYQCITSSHSRSLLVNTLSQRKVLRTRRNPSLASLSSKCASRKKTTTMEMV